MLKEHVKIVLRLLIFADICIIAAAFYTACQVGLRIHVLNGQENHLKFFYGILVMWISCLYVFGMYTSFRLKALKEILAIIFKVAIVGFVVPVSVIYLVKPNSFKKEFIILTVLLITFFLCVEKIILIFASRHFRKRGMNTRNVLIVGTGKRAQHFLGLIEDHNEWGFRIIGFIDEDKTKTGESIQGYKVLGGFDDVPDIIHNSVVDHIVFVVPRQWFERIYGLIKFCELEGSPVSVAVDLFDLMFSKARQTDLHGFPLLTFDSTPDQLWHLLVKRLFDFVFSGICLVVFLPFFIIFAIIIKSTSKGPVIFRQERSGLNGRKFIMYKFRTMVVGAEEKLEALRANNEMTGPVFKMKNDPRATPVGNLFRKLSIDELPQLWNVFIGDMSLVGPRPPLPSEVAKYDNWQRRRLSMKPGLTCLWQIRGRNKITNFEDWMRLDLEYIDNWSLWLDFKILVKTVPVVLLAHGAK